MTRVVVLVGPTGSGKTALSLELAARWNAEIVNADSRQVYRRLDIGSAKPTAAQRGAGAASCAGRRRARRTLRLRALPPARGSQAIADIGRRGKRVLLVGGTGLYIKVLLRGVFAGPSRNSALRARLDAARGGARPAACTGSSSHVDPITAARVHPHDRVRLIRALEVWELTGTPISASQAAHAFAEAPFETLLLGLSLPRAELYARISARCEAMVRDGLIEEVQALYAAGLDPALPALRSLGYREIGEYVRGRCELPAALAGMAQATRRFAKRQLTWFRA